MENHVSLCDALDRVLTKGVVVHGEIKISVAGVDLLYVGLRGLICASDVLESSDSHRELETAQDKVEPALGSSV